MGESNPLFFIAARDEIRGPIDIALSGWEFDSVTAIVFGGPSKPRGYFLCATYFCHYFRIRIMVFKKHQAAYNFVWKSSRRNRFERFRK